MKPHKETFVKSDDLFPVDIFINNNNFGDIVSDSHWHDYIEILFFLEGSAIQQINDKSIEVNTNDIIVLQPGDIHGTWCINRESTNILVIKFMPQFIGNSYSTLFESKYIASFLHNKNDKISFFPNKLLDIKGLRELCIQVFDEFSTKKIGYEIFVKGCIYKIIALLIRNDSFNFYSVVVNEKEFLILKPLLEYIEKNYTDDISLSKASQMVNMSYYHFSRFFKKVTGRNFKEYLYYVRVCEAEKLILSGGKSISIVSELVGFNNVSCFNRVYKRIRGYPPSTIIKNEQKLQRNEQKYYGR
jgi:AraC-like DNA-binding protein/mannose-6-phosphate isomerase-like protein (cupin superfamily)